MRLAVRTWGPEDGVPVLALHGWQDNAATFDLLAPKLDGIRILALDLPGHGLSDHKPVGVGYAFLDWVLDVRAAADALELDRFAILAHSLGAGIANALAGTWPDRVTRIAAIDGFAPRVDEAGLAPQRLAECYAQRARLEQMRMRVFADVEAAAARLAERIVGLPIEGARLLAERGTRAVDGGVTWRRDPRIQAGPPIRLTEEQIRAFLRKVQCEVLLVRPKDGWKVADEVLESVRRDVGSMRIERIDGGHHVHLERVDAVAELVGPFLREA